MVLCPLSWRQVPLKKQNCKTTAWPEQLKLNSIKQQQQEKKDKKRAQINTVTSIEKSWLERKESRKCKEIEVTKDKEIENLKRQLEETMGDLQESRECVKILDERLQLQASQQSECNTNKKAFLKIGESYVLAT